MKNIQLILVLFFFAPFISFAQTVVAKYTVSQDVFIHDQKLGDKKITSLESQGLLYRKGNRYIYFQRPKYLNIFPTGSIRTEIAPNHFYNYSICMDTLQALVAYDMDSLIKRYRNDMSGKGNVNSNNLQHFEPDFYLWNLFEETKVINGFTCQKATLTHFGKLEWIVWFNPDIPMQAGIRNVMDLPGLVVEGENIPLRTRYSLESYSVTDQIPDEIFWPAEFDQPFERRRDLKRENFPGGKSKLQKQVELMEQ